MRFTFHIDFISQLMWSISHVRCIEFRYYFVKSIISYKNSVIYDLNN